MSKLKSIFCAAFLFIVCAVMCVGCSFDMKGNIDEDDGGISNTPTETIPTLSLTEAELIIMDALEVNNNPTNRNLLEKFGTFRFLNDTNNIYYNSNTNKENYTESHVEGSMEYSNNKVVKYYSKTVHGESYQVGDITYVLSEDEIYEAVNSSYNPFEIINTVLSTNSFDYIFQNEVKKVTTADGFDLIIESDLKGVMQILWLWSNTCTAEELNQKWAEYKYEMISKDGYTQDIAEECCLSLKLNFNKYKDIIGTDLEMVYLDWSKDEFVQKKEYLSIRKATAEITQPEWVTEYLENQN